MATLTFSLRENKNNSASIILVFSYGRKKLLRYSTGEKVKHISNWDDRRQKVKNVTDEPLKDRINSRLNKLKDFFEDKYDDLSNKKGIEVTNEVLKHELDIYFEKPKVKIKNDSFKEFIPFYKWYIDFYKTNPLPNTGKPLANSTIKSYKTALKIIEDFNKTNYNLTYNKITVDFLSDFISYLYEFNYSTNYIASQIRNIKTIMNSSFEKGFHSNLEYKSRYFKMPFEEVSNVFLNEDELTRLLNYDLTNFKTTKINNHFQLRKKTIEVARDLFLIGSYTGLRVSDFNNLNKENFISEGGKEFLRVITQKTNKIVTIPIHPVVKIILDKNGGAPPNSIPHQHINYAIKELARLCKIDDNVTNYITKGGKKVETIMKKYELVSNHTARRSFCTNAYLAEMPTIDIMTISGHTTEAVFLNYIKANDIDKAKKIATHKFFNPTN